MMKAYVSRNRSGAVTRGWLFRDGAATPTAVRRRLSVAEGHRLEEVSVETALRGAAPSNPARTNRGIGRPTARAAVARTDVTMPDRAEIAFTASGGF